MTECCNEQPTMATDRWADRDTVQSSIAAQLASNHGHSWIYMDDALRNEYLADADALISQGMTPYWEDPHIPANPSPQLEAEIFEFDCAMTWFMEYLDNSHPGWAENGQTPASHIEQADPRDWDAWVSVAVTASETAKQLWSQRLAEMSEIPPVTDTHRATLPPPAASAPPALLGGILRERVISAAGAALAHRHGRNWLDLPADARAAYASDVESLMAVGLVISE